MFRKIGDALRRFMAGRYGTDKLNQWLLGLAIVWVGFLAATALSGTPFGQEVLRSISENAFLSLLYQHNMLLQAVSGMGAFLMKA